MKQQQLYLQRVDNKNKYNQSKTKVRKKQKN